VRRKIVSTISIVAMMMASFFLVGCVRNFSFSYSYDDLRQNLIEVQIIYIEERAEVFAIHSHLDLTEECFDYELRRSFAGDEMSAIIKVLAGIEFTYSQLIVPMSVSSIFHIQGYVLKLRYADDSFIMVAQQADYRYGKSRFSQIRTGRRVSDEIWLDFISIFID